MTTRSALLFHGALTTHSAETTFYTAPADSIVLVKSQLYTKDSASTSNLFTYHRHGGVSVPLHFFSNPAQNVPQVVTDWLVLEAGDTLRYYITFDYLAAVYGAVLPAP